MADTKRPASDEIAPAAMASTTPTASEAEAEPISAAPKTSPQDPEPEALEFEEPETVRSRMRISAILMALYLVLFIAALDQSIVATTIPTITSSLHSAAGYVWIGGAYLLANAAAGPIWARVSDIWGRKIVLLAAIAVFAVASIIAALATSMPMLIAGRALQGTAGGGLMPLVTITISDLFSVRRRALYLSLLGIMWAVAGSAGPLVGGALTELATWRWCFWLNLPVCAVSFVLCLLFLDVHNPRTPLADGLRALDWYGTVSMLGVTVLLLLGLDFGGAVFPWSSPKVICLVAVGGALILVFVYCEKRLARYPLIPLGMFSQPSNLAIVVVGFAHSIMYIGAEFYLPLYFQAAMQASPLRSGVLIVPMMATEAVWDIAAGVFIHQTGRYRELIWGGTILTTLGMGLFILFGNPDLPLGQIVGYQLLLGTGVAVLFQSPTIAIQNTVSQAETATATSTLNFVRSMATCLSIVLGGVVFQNSMNGQQGRLAQAGLSPEVLSALTGENAAANVGIVKLITDPVQKGVVKLAFASSLRNIFIMYTAISAVGLVASVFIKAKRLNTEHTETKTGIANMAAKKPNNGE